MIDHVIEDSEQFFLIKELLKTLCDSIVLLKHEIEFFYNHLVDHIVHLALLISEEFVILLELFSDLVIQ